MAFPAKPVVLLTNDDGPPCDSSPNIYSFAKTLQRELGWKVRVVIPDCQKSWVGKAYAINDIIEGKYFYPLEPDGREGEITSTRRPLKEGESMEWILLSGTPATCANIGLHNIYPGEIDLVLSGPNHGRNSSSAFTLSSGTIGAALSGVLAAYPSIALSYGVVTRPVPQRVTQLANEASVRIVEKLWKDWGRDEDPVEPVHASAGASGSGSGGNGGKSKSERVKGKVQLYNVNVPLVEEDLEVGKRRVVWTRIARNGYGSLFKKKTATSGENTWDAKSSSASTSSNSKPVDPSSLDAHVHNTSPSPSQPKADESNTPQKSGTSGTAGPAVDAEKNAEDAAKEEKVPDEGEKLRFHFAPDVGGLITPAVEDRVVGTDTWALLNGYISVTPLQASFAHPSEASFRFASQARQDLVEGDIPGLWDEL